MDTQRKKFFRYRAENTPIGWLYLLPALLFISLFNIYPLIRTFIMSFQKGTLNNPEFNGLKNFEIVLKDPKFHTAIYNTIMYAMIVVPVALVISLFIAITIHDKIKFKKIFESIFFIPYLTSVIAIGIVFRYLFNDDYGFINYIIQLFGGAPVKWLNSPQMSMTTVIIFGVWMGLAFNIIILLTGLRNIDESYYKVADMFGATKKDQFLKITLPQLIPTLTFLSLVNFIGAFKIYGQVYAIFNGLPGMAESATTGVFYIYTKFYSQQRYGQGMAAAVILFFIILIFTIIQNRVMKRMSR